MIDIIAGFAIPNPTLSGSWWFHPHARCNTHQAAIALRVLGFHIGVVITWRWT